MKSHLLLVPMLLVLAACGGGSEMPETLPEVNARIAELKAELRSLEARKAELDTAGAANAKTKLVQVQSLKPQAFEHYVELQGRVESDLNVMVSPQVPGTILSLPVREGQNVAKGQLLARLDDAVLRQQLEEVKTGLSLARTNFEKRERLWAQKIGTELQYLEAKTNKESLENREATLQRQLDLYAVYSPIAGRIEMLPLKPGELASPGLPLAQVVGTGGYKLMVNVPETYALKVKNGDPAQLTLPDLNTELQARVANVGTTINPVSRTFSVEISLPNQPNLKPNMIAYAKLKDYQNPSALVVPVTLLKGDDEGRFIFVAERDAKGQLVARRKAIRVGQLYGGLAEVLEGLKEGESIITTGYLDLAEGQVLQTAR